MEHPRRVVFHLGLLEIEIFRLIVSDPDLKTTIVIDVRATRGSARWPAKITFCEYMNEATDVKLSLSTILWKNHNEETIVLH